MASGPCIGERCAYWGKPETGKWCAVMRNAGECCYASPVPGADGVKQPDTDVAAQAARIKELEARECREDRCEHVRNSAEATTQCLEYQGRIKALEAERDSWKDDDLNGRVAYDTLREERDALKARCEALEEACRRQVENIERWQETGEPAGPDESKSIYDQLKAALRAAGE